jgi:hypothetical protein
MIDLLRKIIEFIHSIDIIFNPYVFPIIFISLWIFVSFTSARKSGWNKLKEKFRYKKNIKNAQYCMGEGQFSKTHYGGLRIGLCNDGIIIKQYMHLLFFHPALFFPWVEISNIKISVPQKSFFNIFDKNLRAKITRQTLFAQSAEISFRDYHEIKVRFPWRKAYQVFLPKDLTVIGNV